MALTNEARKNPRTKITARVQKTANNELNRNQENWQIIYRPQMKRS
jgi:hypothetical protein